jgi:hypothetical protein
MYSRSANGVEKGDPNRNPWLAKMHKPCSMQTFQNFLFYTSHALFVHLSQYLRAKNSEIWYFHVAFLININQSEIKYRFSVSIFVLN